MFTKTTKFARVSCALCLGYTCIHVGQTLFTPFNDDDATPMLIAQSTDTGVDYYDITTAYAPNLEVQYRTDMPWEKGFMVTKGKSWRGPHT